MRNSSLALKKLKDSRKINTDNNYFYSCLERSFKVFKLLFDGMAIGNKMQIIDV